MAQLIKFENVSKKFGKNQVLNDLNFSINNKDVYGIIGLSGSGKTTILNVLIGFLKTSSGKIFFKNNEITKNKKDILQSFGFATQTGSFYNRLTVKENLLFFGKLYKKQSTDLKTKVNELIELIELKGAENLLAKELSTGMKRRLDIACALLNDPEVLILDEPTEDLDPILRKEVLALIKKINLKKNTTIVITSHLLSEMETICSKIAILHNGKIMESGTPDKLKENYSKNEEIHLVTNPGDYDRILKNLSHEKIKHIINKGHKIVVYTPNAELVLYHLIKAIEKSKERLVDLDVSKPTLEEVFESLTKK